MTFITGLVEALQYSRRREAERVIRRYWHLVEQGREHERKCKIGEASRNAARAAPEPYTPGEKLCVSQT